MFRDWLSTHPADRLLYESAKRAAIPGGDVMDYNRRKSAVILEIYDRLFRAAECFNRSLRAILCLVCGDLGSIRSCLASRWE